MSDLLDTPTPDVTPPPADLLAGDTPPPADSLPIDPKDAPPVDPDAPRLLAGKYKTPEDLEKAYKELTALHRKKQDVPDKYDLKAPDGFEVDEALLARFKEAGFTQKQAQNALDVMAERVVPKVKEVSREAQELLLRAKFGYTPEDEAYPQFIAQLRDWATQNLPDEVVTALRRTPDGVIALHKLRRAQMSDNSTTPTRAASTRTEQQDLADIQRQMRDPRYLKDANYRNEINGRLKKHMAA